MEKLIELSLIISLALGVLLVTSLLWRRNNLWANRMLCGLILCQLYLQWICYLEYTGKILQFRYLIRTPLTTNLMSCGFLYLYTRALTVPGFRMRPSQLRCFIPVIIGPIWYLSVYRFFNRYDLWSQTRDYYFERWIRGSSMLIIFSIYYMICLKLVWQYRARTVQYFSNVAHVRLTWLYVILGSSFGLWAIGFSDIVLGPDVTLWNLAIPAITISIYLLAVFSLRQSTIFSADIDWEPSENRSNKSKTPLLDEDDLAHELQRLASYMQSQKPHLNPELRLNDLAKGLNLKPYILSEVINRGTKMNFYDYINRHRVEEFKRRAKASDSAHLSILGIAVDCGFNSKSVFNEAFKKYNGNTPSEFRRLTFESAEPDESKAPEG